MGEQIRQVEKGSPLGPKHIINNSPTPSNYCLLVQCSCPLTSPSRFPLMSSRTAKFVRWSHSQVLEKPSLEITKHPLVDQVFRDKSQKPQVTSATQIRIGERKWSRGLFCCCRSHRHFENRFFVLYLPLGCITSFLRNEKWSFDAHALHNVTAHIWEYASHDAVTGFFSLEELSCFVFPCVSISP